MRHDRSRTIRLAPALLLAAALLCVPFRAGGEEAPKKVPVAIKADKLDYDRATDVYVAEGHVRVEHEGMVLEADRVVLNNRTGDALAEGKVYLREKQDVLTADRLEVNLNTRSGVITKGKVFRAKEHFHISGDKIERRSETVYHVEQGAITTCDEGEWYLEAGEIDVDMNKYATANNVSFKIAGLPVFYTPYFLFPVRRQSGLLIPEGGYNSNEGFLMKNAFFWAISDHTDMTLTSDYRDNLGHGTGVEYRYVNSRDSSGSVYYKFFDIKHDPVSRWEFQFQHHEEFAEDLSARADINLVSDERYYYDLEKSLELRSRPYLDSNAFYVERWDTASLSLGGQYTTDLTQANDATIQKLPELRYTVYQERIAGPLHLNFDGSAASFTRQVGTDVRRADFNPELTAAVGARGFGFTPRVGARATFYDRGETTNEPVDRTYAYAGADLNVKVSRAFGADASSGRGIGRVRHSIETGVSYSYVPRMDLGDVPQLDIVEDEQLAQGTNVITASLVNRLTARYREEKTTRTYDMMVFLLSQSYDLDKARSSAPDAQSRSAITGEFFFKTPKMLGLTATGKYDTYTDRMTSSSAGATFTGDVLRFDVSRQYLREPRTEFLIVGGGLKLAGLDIWGQVWRDRENSATTQEEYKVFYSAQCWGLGVKYVKKPGEVQYLFGFELKGIGGAKL